METVTVRGNNPTYLSVMGHSYESLFSLSIAVRNEVGMRLDLTPAFLSMTPVQHAFAIHGGISIPGGGGGGGGRSLDPNP